MIFAGDVAIAPGEIFNFIEFPPSFFKSYLIMNLEGVVSIQDNFPYWGVCNSNSIFQSFKKFNIGPVFIGNNHVDDFPNGIVSTLKHIELHGLLSFGFQFPNTSGNEVVVFNSGDINYALLGFGWRVIGCKPCTDRTAGVNIIEGTHVRSCVRQAIENYPGKRVVAVMHWNYEFEPYPQPAHRKLAMELIDAGVHAVIGHHPHIVGPVERYRGHTIAYSLGNWAFSYGRFFGGKLRFPESSFHQIAVELGKTKDTVHHARFSPPSNVTYEFSEDVASEKFSLKPEFEGYSHAEYIRWFRKNRVKRKGLPIYKNADASIGNLLRDRWVSIRQVLVDAAAKTGIKPMRRGV